MTALLVIHARVYWVVPILDGTTQPALLATFSLELGTEGW